MPLLSQVPKGCRFGPRCPYADEKCLTQEQQLVAVDDNGHKVRCCHSVLFDGWEALE